MLLKIERNALVLNSLLAWTSREIVGWTPFLLFLLLVIQLDRNDFNNAIEFKKKKSNKHLIIGYIKSLFSIKTYEQIS